MEPYTSMLSVQIVSMAIDRARLMVCAAEQRTESCWQVLIWSPSTLVRVNFRVEATLTLAGRVCPPCLCMSSVHHLSPKPIVSLRLYSVCKHVVPFTWQHADLCLFQIVPRSHWDTKNDIPCQANQFVRIYGAFCALNHSSSWSLTIQIFKPIFRRLHENHSRPAVCKSERSSTEQPALMSYIN